MPQRQLDAILIGPQHQRADLRLGIDRSRLVVVPDARCCVLPHPLDQLGE